MRLDRVRMMSLRLGVVLTFAAQVAAGCGKHDPGPGPKLPGVVTGAVLNANTSQPVADAIIVSGAARDTTRADGLFRLSLPAGTASITVSKVGFTLNQMVVSVGAGATQQVTVGLLPVGATQTLATSTGGVVTDPNTNARISLPANFVSVSGDVNVSITGLDPTTGDVRALPGGLDAVDAGGRAVYLNPVSFAEYTVRDAAGNVLPFNSSAGAGANIELPIPVSLRGQPGYGNGDPIECYLYDPTDGKWKTPVPGVIGPSSADGSPAIKATIFHLSWYGGAPATNDRACIGGYVKNESGTAAAGVGVEAFAGASATTDATGHYQVDASPNSTIRVVATKVSGGGVQTGEVVVQTSSTRDSCSHAPDIVLTNSTGSYLVLAALADGDISDSSQVLCRGVYVNISLLVEGGVAPAPITDAHVEINSGAGWNTVPYVGGGGFGNDYVLCASGPGFSLRAGQSYDLRIDYDRDGTIDATGQVRMAGVPNITYPTEGTIVSPSFTATWTDPGSSTGYTPNYLLQLDGEFDTRQFLTSDRSKVIGDGSVDTTFGGPQANDPLAAGAYRMTVIGTTGPLAIFGGFLDPPNVTGANTQGYLFGLGVGTPVSFESTGAPGLRTHAPKGNATRIRRPPFGRLPRPVRNVFEHVRAQRIALR